MRRWQAIRLGQGIQNLAWRSYFNGLRDGAIITTILAIILWLIFGR